ncbi:hypothetical protein QYM36_013102, partial [Artemia franciscana]
HQTAKFEEKWLSSNGYILSSVFFNNRFFFLKPADQKLESVVWKKPGKELVSACNNGKFIIWTFKEKELEPMICTPFYSAEGEE